MSQIYDTSMLIKRDGKSTLNIGFRGPMRHEVWG